MRLTDTYLELLTRRKWSKSNPPRRKPIEEMTLDEQMGIEPEKTYVLGPAIAALDWARSNVFPLTQRLGKQVESSPFNVPLQQYYAHLLGKSLTKTVEIVYKGTGVKPSEDITNKAYAEYISNRSFDKLEELMHVQGTKPSEALVQRGYAAYLHTASLGDCIMLQRLTGIKPKVDQEIAQQTYRALLRGEAVRSFPLVEQLTGRSPNISKEEIQETYATYVLNDHLDGVLELQRISGVKPVVPASIVHRAYKGYREGDNFDDSVRLQKITGISPPEGLEKMPKSVPSPKNHLPARPVKQYNPEEETKERGHTSLVFLSIFYQAMRVHLTIKEEIGRVKEELLPFRGDERFSIL